MIEKNAKEEIIISFPNETQVLKMESIIKKNKLTYKIKPIPREISTGCGLCIYTSKENKSMIENLIKENDIKIEKIFEKNF